MLTSVLCTRLPELETPSRTRCVLLICHSSSSMMSHGDLVEISARLGPGRRPFRSFSSSLAEVKAQESLMPVSTLGWPGSPIPSSWRTGELPAIAHCRRFLISQQDISLQILVSQPVIPYPRLWGLPEPLTQIHHLPPMTSPAGLRPLLRMAQMVDVDSETGGTSCS
jgi:hypothetical protein